MEQVLDRFLRYTKVFTTSDPESETFSTWIISGTSGIFGALAVGSFHPILLAYPIYIIIANYMIVVMMLLGKRRTKN
jgi:hypothetical protein